MEKILITGTTGFIGSKVSEMLLEDENEVVGIDNFNGYHDVTILRYFTVYGPAGRPGMSIFRFIKWIKEGSPSEIFGDGSQERDFTYVEDIAKGTIKALKPLVYEVINLGNNHPHKLSKAIELIEKYTGKQARFKYKGFHKADMKATCGQILRKRKNFLIGSLE